MHVAILVQHLKSSEHIFSHRFNFLPGEPLLPRGSCYVVVKVLKHNRWWLGWVFYLVQQRTQSRCTALKALENFALIMEAPMSFNAFDHDGIFLLVAIGYC
jgi:hypothetical protein